VEDDVRDIGKVVGVKYKCDTMNSFNLLTREGRREWREAGGGEVVCGVVGGVGVMVKGVDVGGIGGGRVGGWFQRRLCLIMRGG